MNEFDQFVKRDLQVKHYARYTDDFVIVSGNLAYLEGLLPPIRPFLKERLSLDLHLKKVGIHKLGRGVDFLVYTTFPNHRLLRTKTRRRIFKNFELRLKEFEEGALSKEKLEGALNSYLGVLGHADAYGLQEKLKNEFWFSR